MANGDDFINLKEWATITTRQNTNSRRFSASNLRSEYTATSFRSNVTVSSTASSPGYTPRDEIDPSKYSFTTALKALQAKTWEQGDGFSVTLNSKWNDAEKYICNPLSGQVPLECLSAKTLSSRRITMSAPLIYPSQLIHPNPPPLSQSNPPAEKKTRDVGTQSTPLDLSSSSPSPARTPSIQERSRKMSEGGDSSTVYSEKLKSETEVEESERERERKKEMMWICRKRGGGGGCLISLKGLWRRAILLMRQTDKNKNTSMPPTSFLYHIHGCSNDQ